MAVQAADFVRIFTEFSNHVSFIVAGKLLAFIQLYFVVYYYFNYFPIFTQISYSISACWAPSFGWTVSVITFGRPSVHAMFSCVSPMVVNIAIIQHMRGVSPRWWLVWRYSRTFFSTPIRTKSKILLVIRKLSVGLAFGYFSHPSRVQY